MGRFGWVPGFAVAVGGRIASEVDELDVQPGGDRLPFYEFEPQPRCCEPGRVPGQSAEVNDETLLWLHAGATLYMVGLIWFVQVVHYPLMGQVGESSSCAYADANQARTGWVVIPPMLTEAGTTAWLLFDAPSAINALSLWVGAGLLAVIWLSTICLQMPCHARLSARFDLAAVRRLVNTNWIRTLAWSARGFVAIDFLRTAAAA